MRSRDVVGKRIVKVHQQRVNDGRGGTVWDLDSLELEDGTRLIPMTIETEGDYCHKLLVSKPERGRKVREKWPPLDIGKEHERRNRERAKEERCVKCGFRLETEIDSGDPHCFAQEFTRPRSASDRTVCELCYPPDVPDPPDMEPP